MTSAISACSKRVQMNARSPLMDAVDVGGFMLPARGGRSFSGNFDEDWVWDEMRIGSEGKRWAAL